jgi:hypothetical protein
MAYCTAYVKSTSSRKPTAETTNSAAVAPVACCCVVAASQLRVARSDTGLRTAWLCVDPAPPNTRSRINTGAQRPESKSVERLSRYSDEKVANRDTKVWHGATENGP